MCPSVRLSNLIIYNTVPGEIVQHNMILRCLQATLPITSGIGNAVVPRPGCNVTELYPLVTMEVARTSNCSYFTECQAVGQMVYFLKGTHTNTDVIMTRADNTLVSHLGELQNSAYRCIL